MNGAERPWEDMHHRSCFLPDISRVENGEFKSTMSRHVDRMVNTLARNGVYAEENMDNILEIVPINISRTPDVVENVFIGAKFSQDKICEYMTLFKEFRDVFAWSYKEMSGIYPRILQHDIQTYENMKLVRQNLQPMNPRKETTIKDKVEKLLKDGFIYPVPLMEWMSNLVPVDKKQSMIQVCMDLWDLNKVCQKYNFPMPFIDQIIDECTWKEIFSFMDGFSGYNQIEF
jgi:hypothetical protein